MDGLKSKTLSTAFGYLCGFEMVAMISYKIVLKVVFHESTLHLFEFYHQIQKGLS